MKKIYLLLFLTCLSCAEPKEYDPIQFALASDSEKIQKVMRNLQAHEVQIMVSDTEGDTYKFQINNKDYFYPASSVKFPIALLALEKANKLAEINSKTIFQVEGDSIKTTIRDEVQKIFAVSDNQAYNRLFEFLRPFEINTLFPFYKKLNLVRISHRVGTKNADDTQMKAVAFFKNDSVIYEQSRTNNGTIESLNLNRIKKGKGYYKNDSLIMEPMDFSKKNYLTIAMLHEIMNRLHFPHKYEEFQRFDITESDRDFLLKVMHKTPKEQGFTDPEYYDSYVKFFMFGDSKDPIPDHIKMYNKVGYAYGYLTDCAYVVDTKNDISFIITATIHVNENQIFNDDTYEYDEIGIPFLAELGRQVYQYYLNKKQ
ncbi:serine hydrolase [Kordia sp.]|uniref:serine hydrolase n=1 Tax=Kordia sp. TaxID=1965332 RepID=UPI0025B86BC9|nr:serine hydrolase [Kordia sp.]MCH2193694.1 serine hydrolase [Kordia sp.]